MPVRRIATEIKDKTRKLAGKRLSRGRPLGELVIITGMSGSGKASVLKAFEDLGYYCVDNLPVQLIPQFADLAVQSGEIRRTALVVDVREASDSVLVRRFSETRRPHPLGTDSPVKSALKAERRHLGTIRAMADLVIDTSKFNVH